MTQRQLGRGRFATVVEGAEGTAVKIIDVDDQRTPHNWRAELAGLKLLAGRPHVVQLLSYEEPRPGTIEPQLRLVMPRYNMTLEHVIYEYAKAKYPPGSGWRNVMPRDRADAICLGVAHALAACHKIGIIHRDVKPENILFTDASSEPVLTDFGIAWVPGIGEMPRVCDIATGEYKAPELLWGLEYGPQVDLWALGCIWARLISTDTRALFSPYTSDVALLGAQLDLLGSPDLTPALKGTLAEHMPQNMPPKLSFPAPVDQLLSFDANVRPTAASLISEHASHSSD